MIRFAKALIASLLIAIPVFAQDNISLDPGPIGNGRLLGAKTYDGQTTVGVLGIDSSGNTTLQSLSGKTVSLPGTATITGLVTATAGLTATTGNIIATSATAKYIRGASSIDSDITAVTGSTPGFTNIGDADTGMQYVAVNIGADSTGADFMGFKTRSTAADANTIVSSGDVLMRLRALGADGAAYRPAASIEFTVSGTPGSSDMPGKIALRTTPDGSATLADVLTLDQDKAALFTGTVRSSATSDIGWSVVAGANTACNTTCTSACVFGWDAGTTAIVNCASALADNCVCAGAS